MKDDFCLNIDRLVGGKVEAIHIKIPSKELEIEEDELVFPGDIAIEGEAYLTTDHLILHLNIKTEAKMPCSVCNELKGLEVSIPQFYHAEPLNEIPCQAYDFKDKVREAILLEVPAFYGCKDNDCPMRQEVESHLKKKVAKQENQSSSYLPFSNIEEDLFE